MLGMYLAMLETEEEKSQFEQIYLQYNQKMYAVAFSILHNKHDAEDAVHQSFLTIANNFKKIISLSCQECLPYIVIIVRNTSINFYNQNKRFSEQNSPLDEEISVNENYFEQIDFSELVNKISTLPQIYKDTIFLYYVYGFSAKEIALMFKISADTVWKRLERARKMLKKELERNNEYATK